MSGSSLFSVYVDLAELNRGPVIREVEASDAERQRLAKALDIDALHALSAKLTLSPWLDGAEVRGRWTARIEQTCGVSLERFETELTGLFEVKVVPAGSPNAPQTAVEVDIDPDAEDPPEVVENGRVDVGQLTVEHLALEIDPYPRKPGAAFEAPPEEQPPSPFDVLRKLRD